MVDPFAGKDPSPGISTDVALVVVQLKTDLAPTAILLGWAVNVIVGATL